MPIFISYSHANKNFVDKLARQLVMQNVNVWVDKWELSIGDSIIDKVQNAIAGATALLVVLSKASVESAWCKKELNAGLIRELEEKRIVVMPVLLEDCSVPIFLREKYYADFRTDFDEGLRTILEGIAKVTSPTLSRHTEDEKYHTDWSIDHGKVQHLAAVIMNFISHSIEQPYSCLTNIEILLSDMKTDLFFKTAEKSNFDKAVDNVITDLYNYFTSIEPERIILSSSKEVIKTHHIETNTGDFEYRVRIGARRLGEDTGKDILINVTDCITLAYERIRTVFGHK